MDIAISTSEPQVVEEEDLVPKLRQFLNDNGWFVGEITVEDRGL